MLQDIESFTSKGEPCSFGCAQNELEYWIEAAHKRETRKRVIAVKNWSLWDLDESNDVLVEYQAAGFQPIFLFAAFVLSDSSGQFQPGYWVRTSPLQALHDNVLFETRNTIYVLSGFGDRKKVKPSLIFNLAP